MVLYCSGMMYEYYSRIVFLPIKKIRNEKIFIEKYSTIYQISSKTVFVPTIFKMFLLCTMIKYSVSN